jgi:hypothetical protein
VERLIGSPSFGDDDHTNVLSLPNDPQNDVSTKQAAPPAIVTPAEKYLCNLIAARKIDDRFRRVTAFQFARFDMKIPCKIQMSLDRTN